MKAVLYIKKNISVTNHDKNILTSNVSLNIINTVSTNLITVFTSSETKSLNDSSTLLYHFTSFTNYLPPKLLADSIINVITILPKIWCKKSKTKFKPLICNDLDEELYSFKPFGKVSSARRNECTALDRTLFFEMNLLTRQNFSEIITLASMSTLLLEIRFFSFSNPIKIVYVDEECRSLFSTSNSVSIQVMIP